MAQVRTLNLEHNRPTVAEAERRLRAEIAPARAAGVRVLRVIHGYGSSGQGGALREGIRRWLRLERQAGKLRGFVAGEDWGPYDDAAQALLREVPELKGDRDWGRENYGITLVML
jgi:hypothetical protein